MKYVLLKSFVSTTFDYGFKINGYDPISVNEIEENLEITAEEFSRFLQSIRQERASKKKARAEKELNPNMKR